MTNWIKHDGGPQPVADDVWVYVSGSFNSNYPSEASDADWPNVKHFLVLNQHLINAARLEGIRLGLEAAARTVDAEAKDWHADIPWIDIDYPSEPHPVVDTIRALRTEANAIRALDPETIAKEAAPPVRKDHRADAAADAFYVEEADQ